MEELQMAASGSLVYMALLEYTPRVVRFIADIVVTVREINDKCEQFSCGWLVCI